MANEELIEETNSLIKKLLELDAQQKADAAKSMADFDAKRSEWKKKLEEDPDAFRQKMKAQREEAEKKLEEARAKELAYRERVIEALDRQTKLLEQIAERLGA